jgi:hypothetical protein
MVTRWDSGTFAWEERKEDLIAVSLSGMRTCGQVILRHLDGEEWAFKLLKEPQVG